MCIRDRYSIVPRDTYAYSIGPRDTHTYSVGPQDTHTYSTVPHYAVCVSCGPMLCVPWYYCCMYMCGSMLYVCGPMHVSCGTMLFMCVPWPHAVSVCVLWPRALCMCPVPLDTYAYSMGPHIYSTGPWDTHTYSNSAMGHIAWGHRRHIQHSVALCSMCVYPVAPRCMCVCPMAQCCMHMCPVALCCMCVCPVAPCCMSVCPVTSCCIHVSRGTITACIIHHCNMHYSPVHTRVFVLPVMPGYACVIMKPSLDMVLHA